MNEEKAGQNEQFLRETERQLQAVTQTVAQGGSTVSAFFQTSSLV